MRLDSCDEGYFGTWYDEVDFILQCELNELVKLGNSNVDVFHVFLCICASIACSMLARVI